MNTIQIFNDLSHMRCAKKNNFNVLPADLLPFKVPTRPYYICVNTVGHKYLGEHWVCMYIPKKYTQSIEYFDSSGTPPMANNYFSEFIKNNCNHYVYSPLQLQSASSNVCGEWCVTFLHDRCTKKRTLKQFINQFDANNQEQNDLKIIKMYNRIHKTGHIRKMTQHGRGVNTNIVCNQSCIPREQRKMKKM